MATVIGGGDGGRGNSTEEVTGEGFREEEC